MDNGGRHFSDYGLWIDFCMILQITYSNVKVVNALRTIARCIWKDSIFDLKFKISSFHEFLRCCYILHKFWEEAEVVVYKFFLVFSGSHE